MPKADKTFVGSSRDACTVGQRVEVMDNEQRLNRLKYLRGKVDWNIKEERKIFLYQLYKLIHDWENRFPNIREILSTDEIKCLLSELMSHYPHEQASNYPRERFIKIVIQSGYKDEPELDEAGRPVLLRDTILLQAGRSQYVRMLVPLLFKIFDRFDVNYRHESGYSHFHVACRLGLKDVVEKFLQAGQDPNLLVDGRYRLGPFTVVSRVRPLQMVLEFADRKKEMMELLLRGGADPNRSNFCMSLEAPLHLICKMNDVELLDAFFKVNDELGNEVKVDIMTDDGLSPLQVAVILFYPDVVAYLLRNRNADTSKLEHLYHEGVLELDEFSLKVVASSLAILDLLEEHGAEVDETVVDEFKGDNIRHLLEKMAALAENWYEREDLRREAERITVKPGLSLYRLLQLPYHEAGERLTYMEFWEFARLDKLNGLPQQYRENCALHLIKTMSRGYLERWGRPERALHLVNSSMRSPGPGKCQEVRAACEIHIFAAKSKPSSKKNGGRSDKHIRLQRPKRALLPVDLSMTKLEPAKFTEIRFAQAHRTKKNGSRHQDIPWRTCAGCAQGQADRQTGRGIRYKYGAAARPQGRSSLTVEQSEALGRPLPDSYEDGQTATELVRGRADRYRTPTRAKLRAIENKEHAPSNPYKHICEHARQVRGTARALAAEQPLQTARPPTSRAAQPPPPFEPKHA
ncbi:unnamed protein product [Trichogramma brassicae]|uniref:Uncharacterized protein n=1 Tax=Trichogramma brassicae TaxID=86971 RepID=A0A6H5J123_9HYME|nr:unnamed protein product [Trichogramma brassicae]